MKINWFKLNSNDVGFLFYQLLKFNALYELDLLLVYLKQGPMCNDCNGLYNTCSCNNFDLNEYNLTINFTVQQIKFILSKHQSSRVKKDIEDFFHNDRYDLSIKELNNIKAYILELLE